MPHTIRIKIDGEIFQAAKIDRSGYLPRIDTQDGDSFYLARDSQHIRRRAKDKWRDLKSQNENQFLARVGYATVIDWGLGHSSFEQWLDEINLVQEFTEWDTTELPVDRVGRLTIELGFTPTLAILF